MESYSNLCSFCLGYLEMPEAEVNHSVNLGKEVGILLGLTLVLVVISEILVGSLEETVKTPEQA